MDNTQVLHLFFCAIVEKVRSSSLMGIIPAISIKILEENKAEVA
jgi:hypothetical protein